VAFSAGGRGNRLIALEVSESGSDGIAEGVDFLGFDSNVTWGVELTSFSLECWWCRI